jgi:hypothetical protein
VSGSVADDTALVGAVDDAVLTDGRAYGGITAAPLDGEKPKKPPAQKPDLVIAAIFDREKGSDEQALIAQGKWSPSTVDFVAVAEAGPRKGTTISCANVGDFLGALQAEPAGSLSRVVIVSHSTDGVLGFGGGIAADGTVSIKSYKRGGNPLAGGITTDAIYDLAESHQPMLDEVKTRWGEGGGEIVFFSCNTGEGVSLALMREFATLIGAKPKGYSYSIGYCLEHGRGYTTRTWYETVEGKEVFKIDCENAKYGYAHLKPDRP